MNLTLLTDFYELTMMQGYFDSGFIEKQCIFDLFYRKNPSGNGYAVAAGLQQVIAYIKNLSFTKDDISYLRSFQTFSDDFLDYLSNFKFTGDIYSVKEGTLIFPNEPILIVKAPMIEGQLIETTILNIINHQSLIATKSSRIVYAANNDMVFEFGLRRAQGPDSGLYGARAAIIGGCDATSNTLAGKIFDVPVRGTHAHSWIMSFDDEISAFRAYTKSFTKNCILLVDTYNSLKSGIPNAIKVFEELRNDNKLPKLFGIRLDSGDFAYISKQARKMLDASGFDQAIISASSDLDEYLISSLKSQGSKVNLWGVGTCLITSNDCPSFGGVYKLVAQVSKDGNFIHKIKLSDNPIKITNPGMKKIFRIFDKKSSKMKADLIALWDEQIDPNQNLEIVSENEPWKKMLLKKNEYKIKEILIPIFLEGVCVYKSPSVMEIQNYCKNQKNILWDEHKRLINPQIMPIDLSFKLQELKKSLIKNIKN